MLRLDRPCGLERQPVDREQLPAAVPLLLPERLSGLGERLPQRLLRGADGRLARLRGGEEPSGSFLSFAPPFSPLMCSSSSGLRRQRGELALHQHRGGAGHLPRRGSD